MKKPDPKKLGQIGNRPAECCEWWSGFPTIYEYCSAVQYDDKSPRQTATLLIFSSDGQWRVMLRDRDTERVAWMTGETLSAALELLEESLAADTVQWRLDGLHGTRPATRIKKK